MSRAPTSLRSTTEDRPRRGRLQMIPNSRINQVVLILSAISFSWLGMQAVHEMGHVVGALATNADVKKVVLHPATISRTDVVDNTRPLIVVWAGPMVGVLVPVVICLTSAWMRLPSTFLWRFFAGFCLIANGVYIAFGSLSGV